MTREAAVDAAALCLAVPRVIHEDASCLVVLKPAGQLSVPGRGALAQGSTVQQVQALCAEARVVHRLDMATSGLLLLAKGADAQRAFSRMFEQREIDKRYVAVVDGQVGSAAGDEGEISLPLAADWPNRPRQKVDTAVGKPSFTAWQVLSHGPNQAWTRLSLRPVTGRSHQLRVHLMAIGHPIFGDRLYGTNDVAGAAPRLLLHAESLCFVHPDLGAPLTVTEPAPF